MKRKDQRCRCRAEHGRHDYGSGSLTGAREQQIYAQNLNHVGNECHRDQNALAD
jgi:hypothetical protein